jgi:hypothetical protein
MENQEILLELHPTTKPGHAGACARCGRIGRQRWVDDLVDLSIENTSIVLCEDCYRHLKEADARAWAWFRKYRDRG